MLKSLFFVLLVVAVAQSQLWSNCGTSADHFQITDVTVNPPVPVKGQDITVYASGVLNEQVTGGNVHAVIKYGFLTIVNKNEPFCSSDNPVPCPVPAGNYNHTVSATIPANAPSGKYTANIVAVDQNNQEIACVNVNVNL
ncbi:hypothetical protein CYY_005070 [Polysphondylium violaceum]|uniref:MD-2-related lipid-recognition domain-containing protein n=1 Tax=Polysphondylium violaceum TaxID=133409 RepID=A0A8J4PTJ8_9MYCE|nr:hypothetical protein CYY_005070 [Polysphondylium violaceum]